MLVPRYVTRAFLLLLGLGASAMAACQSSETAGERQVIFEARSGRFGQALEEARRLSEASPGDERLAALYRDAKVAYLLDQGREEVFRGDLTRGLEYLERAETLAPAHPVVTSWLRKTRAQLATHWLDVAAASSGPEHLDESESAYEKVLEYEPENAAARRGLAHVLLLKNYRAGMSKTYFDDGVSSFRDLQLEQARRAFQISRRYRENDPATLRADQVEALMAEERLAQAQDLEASRMFFAARNEYRLVLLIDPRNSGGRAGLDRMDREARAMHSLAEADMEIRRGALEEAAETLDQAQVLTGAQQDNLSLLRSDIEDRRLEDMYAAASSLTDDYRYPEAVVAYEELLALAPEYRDAARRQATLEEFIRLAEEFYAKALEASDDAVAEQFLRMIHPVIWPEYKDVVERLRAIEERREAAQPADGAGGDATGPGAEDER